MNLGIILNEDNKIINHRSLFKVLFNPFFRTMGFEVATIGDDKRLYKRVIQRCKKRKLKFHFHYDMSRKTRILKSRIF